MVSAYWRHFIRKSDINFSPAYNLNRCCEEMGRLKDFLCPYSNSPLPLPSLISFASLKQYGGQTSKRNITLRMRTTTALQSTRTLTGTKYSLSTWLPFNFITSVQPPSPHPGIGVMWQNTCAYPDCDLARIKNDPSTRILKDKSEKYTWLH